MWTENEDRVYVIIDIRSNPQEFLDVNSQFVVGFANARRFTMDEGIEIINGFNKIAESYNGNFKQFMPGLVHIKDFID